MQDIFNVFNAIQVYTLATVGHMLTTIKEEREGGLMLKVAYPAKLTYQTELTFFEALVF